MEMIVDARNGGGKSKKKWIDGIERRMNLAGVNRQEIKDLDP